MNNNDKRIDSLRNLYQTSTTAKSVLDWFADRSNNSGETILDRLLAKIPMDRNEMILVLREFESIGLGKFVIGRRGAQTRFVWSCGLVSVGHVAKGTWNALENWPHPMRTPEMETTQLIKQGDQLQRDGDFVIQITLSPDQVREVLQQQLSALSLQPTR